MQDGSRVPDAADRLDIEAEINRGHYSLLRAVLAERAGVTRDILLEELEQLARRSGEARPSPDLPALAKVLAFNLMDDGSPSAPDQQRIVTLNEAESFALRCLKLGAASSDATGWQPK